MEQQLLVSIAFILLIVWIVPAIIRSHISAVRERRIMENEGRDSKEHEQNIGQ